MRCSGCPAQAGCARVLGCLRLRQDADGSRHGCRQRYQRTFRSRAGSQARAITHHCASPPCSLALASSSRSQVHRSASRSCPRAGLPRLSVGVRGSPPTNSAIVTQVVTGPPCLQAEGAALNKDDQADGDQDHGQQDVTPSAESSGDDGAGGEKPPGDAPAPCGILCGCR